MNIKVYTELGGVILKYPITFIYSLFFCLRHLKLSEAIRCPVLISPRIKIEHIEKGSIHLHQVYPFMVRIGLWGTDGIAAHRGYMNISRGTVTFMGTAVLSRGFSLKQDSGETVFGHNFFCNSNCVIYNNQSICFGDRIIVGWNCSFRTSDGHTIIYSDGSSNHSKPISIGDHVWISANTHVCKGIEIADDCVIAQGSLVTKPLNLCAALYGGRPAKLIKENVKWEI